MQIEQLVTEKEVMNLLHIRSRYTIWKYRKERNFPQPVRTHPSQFRPSDIQAWIDNGGVNQKAS
ncbi:MULTISPECIES: helix-turn-helix transcriptional regulator [Erwiniaceae]|uniref:helix-turn-helix transcriptional regulator n=1 Tax=Erwiniaceae TaxID=1903409 RepID=UPI000C176826|nr:MULTISPECIES: AlpA family transcriptional regulator [Erwiniaceae]PIJ42991.1 AlpA family transcriptional regulator [Tatumella sp. OPLPL6]